MPQLAKNIIYNLLGQGLLLILSVIAVRFVFKQLGEDALGIIYFTLVSNAVICAAFEMGICSTIVREVSAHFRDEPIFIHNLIRTASLYYWSAYVLLGLCIYFGAPFLVEKWITLKTMSVHTATHVLQIMGTGALLTLPQRFYLSLSKGLQRMELSNAIDVGTMSLQLFGSLVILGLGGSLIHIACWFTTCFALSTLTSLSVAAHLFSGRAMVPGFFSSVISRTMRYSLNMLSVSVLSMIQIQADKLILSKLLPISTLGYYSFSYSLIARASIFTEAIAQAALPSFSSLMRAGNRSDLMFQYRRLQDLVCLASVPMLAAIVFTAMPLFTHIFNGEVAKTLLLPTTFLCVGSYMHSAMYIPYIFSIAAGKPEISVKSNALALCTVLPGTGVLIYFYGLAGAGFSWVLYHLFMYAFAVPKICRQCLEVPPGEWYAHTVRILTLAIVVYGLAWVVAGSFGERSLGVLILSYLGASVTFVVAAYGIMGEEIEAALRNLVGALRQSQERTA